VSNFLPFLSISMNLLLAACLACAAIFFYLRESKWEEREEKWRVREFQLIDRLLKKEHVQPLEVQREHVIKIPDPEIAPMSWQDEAMRLDEIKEELEQIYPEVTHMDHETARATYASDWKRIQKQLTEENTAMRVG
jgi:hypothetical protein